jgi:uncharacterized membrane protein YqaE (UPF0057 family)
LTFCPAFVTVDAISTRQQGATVRYLLAIIFPPLAVLLCGKPVQAFFNFFLTLLGWIPGVIHAILVVNGYKADKRAERIEKAIREGEAARA